MNETLPALDFLIHNACQTVRRPPAYYEHLLAGEELERLDPAARALIADHEALVRGRAGETENGSVLAMRDRTAPSMPGFALTRCEKSATPIGRANII